VSTNTLIYGETRTRVAARHALIAPDGHVPSSLPGVHKGTAIVLISKAMGADLTQLLLTFQAGGSATFGSSETEGFAYLLRGSVNVELAGDNNSLEAGGFVFVPAGAAWKLSGPSEGARLNLFFKRFVPLPGMTAPESIVGHESQFAGQPYLGDEDAKLQILLPDRLEFDMAVNIFNYNPGACLPFVETHIMEHGLLMLSGKGVYRLEDRWYPVEDGDCIWMAPYCPQWFTAMGKVPARYLYYKNVNRSVLP
jgi:(S)-ureidoglycine aminohydrolase